METLLNFDVPLDVNVLDRIMQLLYSGNDSEVCVPCILRCCDSPLIVQRNQAQVILTQFKEHPSSWTRVDTILEHSQNEYTRFFALAILSDLIKFRWKILPIEQRQGIKNYLVDLVLKHSSNDQDLKNHRVVLEKLNYSIVQVRVCSLDSLDESLLLFICYYSYSIYYYFIYFYFIFIFIASFVTLSCHICVLWFSFLLVLTV
jgi:exportin-1